MGKNKSNYKFDSVDIFAYIWNKRLSLLIVTLAAAVIAAIVSFMITPKYKSSVVLFPASTYSISKTLLSQSIYGNQDNLKFGDEEEGEQLMQVLYSEEIRNKVIRDYNLVKHYKIDTTAKYWKSKLYTAFAGNVKFKRTEYMSIVIEVLDESPDTAAFIANAIVNQIDTVYSRMQSERANKSLTIVEKEYKAMEKELGYLQDSLTSLRKNNSVATDALVNLIKSETKRLSAIKENYLEAKVDAENIVPHKFILDMAYKADKKASPKRMLIVLVSSLSAFFVALLLMIIRDSIVSRAVKE
jgi:uncharacterized protein involved in exopolysaccharide biosynthesis